MTANSLYPCLCAAVLGALALGLTPSARAQEPAKDELVQLVISLLADTDKDMRALALEQIRSQAAGRGATEQFAAQLAKVPPDVQIGLLSALTDRGDAAARPAIVSLLTASETEGVRVEAIRSLGYLGEPADVPLLLRLLAEGSDAERAAARSSLVRMPGDAVSQAIVAAPRQEEPADLTILLEILTQRRAFSVVPELLPLATQTDARVRAAAMAALGQLAGPEHIPDMIRGILAAARGREREDAEKAVMLVCERIEEPEKRADPLLAAWERLPSADQITVLPALGRVGGAAVKEIVTAAMASQDPARHEAGVRALCNWPNASVAPELIVLIRSSPDSPDQVAALRALIRVAALPDGRTEIEKLELLQTALALCTRDTERNLVLRRAQAVRIPETLRFLLPYLNQPELAQEACQSIVELAHHRALRDAHQAEFHAALDKVMETAEDETVIERARRYKAGQTWVRPKGS
jgi:HEAT repeat protein